jgi:hypothetical protein
MLGPLMGWPMVRLCGPLIQAETVRIAEAMLPWKTAGGEERWAAQAYIHYCSAM